MKIAINGFGRIGRTVFRILEQHNNLKVVAINDLSNATTLAHLIKYDSIHGRASFSVNASGDNLIINGIKIPVFSEKDPLNLPWGDIGVDLLIEATGKFTTRDKCVAHLKSGAKKVIITAPSPDKNIPTVVLGVNDNAIDLNSDILSNASCTTNNIAPMIKILEDNWGIINGYITTVHSMTGDQNLHDGAHNDLRRARAASSSIIPTTTGAAKAITSIFPSLADKLGGAGIRVPVLNGSLTDFTCTLKSQPSVEQINQAFSNAAMSGLKGILEYTDEPIVSVDIIGNSHSCVFDAGLTSVVGGITKVVGWYDNEFGYSSRLVDLIQKIAQLNSI